MADFIHVSAPANAPEMALHVLAYNMKRVMSILGVGGLIERSEHRLGFRSQ